MPRPPSQMVKVQLSSREVDRAESLTGWAERQPLIAPTGHANRSTVLREAIRRGLDSIEREKARDAKG